MASTATRAPAPGTARPRRARGILSQTVAPAAFILLCLVLWEAAVRLLQVRELILPAPSRIVEEAIRGSGEYLSAAGVTVTEAGLGFLIAAVIGILLGTLVALSRTAGSAVYPVLIASQVTPMVAIAPLMIVWFGFGIWSKVVLTTLIAFFPIVINTVTGIHATTKHGLDLFSSLGAGRVRTFLSLRLPSALPVMFTGLKLGATLAVIGAVVGEFAGASSGLGHLLLSYAGQMQTARAFAAILYLILIGLAFFAITTLAERLLVPAHIRRQSER